MTAAKKIATRESYGNALAELGKEFQNLVVLDADLAGATKTGVFKKAFPERFVDCGIAECDLMGIAAGMATCGAIPFASTFAMFASGRAYEIVRNSIGYPHLNVKIGATHAGISVGEDGASHQCNEDLALMRTIPGMTIIVPSDDIESKAAVRAAIETDGPFYLRFGRFAVPVINDRPDYKFEVGKGIVLREGTDVTIVVYSIMVSRAMEAAKALAEAGISAEVIDLRSISPWDKEAVLASVAKTGHAVVATEGPKQGGFGGEISATIAEEAFSSLKAPVQRLGGPFVPIPVAPNLEDLCRVTPADIAAAAKAALGRA